MKWADFSNNMFEKYSKERRPFQMIFEMTPFCNFRCNMCYIRLDPEQASAQGKLLSTEQWLHIAKEARKIGTTILEVTGGEVTTRPDFPVLYEALIKMGFLIHLRTNGYLIKNEIIDLLKKYKPRKISITMYGASDEMYQKVCGVSDGYSVVSQNVLAMRDAGLNIRLTMTVTNDNICDMDALENWGKKHDLKVNPYGGLFTPVRGAKRSIDHLQVQIPEEEFELSEEIVQSTKREIEGREQLLNPFWMCRSFGAKCCISWDGRMTICNTMSYVWTDVLGKGVEDAYRDLYDELKKLRRPQECSSCPYIEFCGACPSQLLSATGDPEKTCEDICKLARRKYKKHYLIQSAEQTGRMSIIDKCEEEDE